MTDYPVMERWGVSSLPSVVCHAALTAHGCREELKLYSRLEKTREKGSNFLWVLETKSNIAQDDIELLIFLLSFLNFSFFYLCLWIARIISTYHCACFYVVLGPRALCKPGKYSSKQIPFLASFSFFNF